MKKILLELDDDLLERLDFIAKLEDRSRSGTIREMLWQQTPHALRHAMEKKRTQRRLIEEQRENYKEKIREAYKNNEVKDNDDNLPF